MHDPHDKQRPSDGPDPRTLKIKTHPPAFINLDDCKPILSTTSTNTSSNSSAHGATAFVFTSSRTLRALQYQEDHYQRASSNASIVSVESTPSTPSTQDSILAHYDKQQQRASLTLSQLVKHSEGAIDARCLIGPKMRAAGFVNLPNTIASRSDRSYPSTPSSLSALSLSSVSGHVVPTPSDPPMFPPIVFVTPSAVMNTPMWEYQKEMGWPVAEANPGRYGFAPSSRNTASSEHSSGAVHALSATSSSYPGSESSDPFSSASSPTLMSGSSNLSSVDETDEDGVCERSKPSKGKAKARGNELSEFPFPISCDSPRSQTSGGSRGSRASSATASPTIVHAIPPAIYPSSSASTTAVSSSSCARRQDSRTDKRSSPRRQCGSSDEKRIKVKVKAKDTVKMVVEPMPSFSTARRLGYQRQYSLTELCDSSLFAWTTKSEMFTPPAPISRTPARIISSTSLISTSTPSRPPVALDSPKPPPHRGHRRHHTTCGSTLNSQDQSGRIHRIASTPIRMPTIHSEPGSGSERESDKARAPNRTGKPRDQALQREDKDSSRALLPAAEIDGVRPGDGILGAPGGAAGTIGGLRVAGTRGRGRDTRGKILGASETMEERAAAHEHAEMDKEKAKALEAMAALALGNIVGERDFARHIVANRARDQVVKQRQRVHHKLRGKTLQDEYPASESETTMVDHQASVIKPLP